MENRKQVGCMLSLYEVVKFGNGFSLKHDWPGISLPGVWVAVVKLRMCSGDTAACSFKNSQYSAISLLTTLKNCFLVPYWCQRNLPNWHGSLSLLPPTTTGMTACPRSSEPPFASSRRLWHANSSYSVLLLLPRLHDGHTRLGLGPTCASIFLSSPSLLSMYFSAQNDQLHMTLILKTALLPPPPGGLPGYLLVMLILPSTKILMSSCCHRPLFQSILHGKRTVWAGPYGQACISRYLWCCLQI